jgi:hypothetical protein
MPLPRAVTLPDTETVAAPPKSGEADAVAAVFPATIVFFRLAVSPKFLMPPAQVVQPVSVDVLLFLIREFSRLQN